LCLLFFVSFLYPALHPLRFPLSSFFYLLYFFFILKKGTCLFLSYFTDASIQERKKKKPFLKGKGKVRPRIGYEDPKESLGARIYYFFNLGARWGGWLTPRFSRFTPGKEIGAPFIGGWVGTRTVVDGCAKSLPHLDSIPGPSSP
jgi:hypothetical protein